MMILKLECQQNKMLLWVLEGRCLLWLRLESNSSWKGQKEQFKSCQYSGSKREFILLFHPKFENK